MKRTRSGRRETGDGRRFFNLTFIVPFFLFLFFHLPFTVSLLPAVYAATPHSITIDGDISEWRRDEIIWDDSRNDSPWGVSNEIHALYLTWDASALYIGVSGVQKDGNNMIVYIDTSPLSGISDASALKEPGNPSSLWWWRRGNKFPEGFRPDFQWHMYEMKLNTGDGHGFFRLQPDGNTTSLNGSVQQAATGGGAAIPGSAEIRIPWSVLYGGAGFPEGEALRLAAMVTGGMDTRGTSDPSDDLFGSARDTAPDQKASFPDVWHEAFTLDTWLTVKLESSAGDSGGEGRSPVPRNVSVLRKSSSSVVVSWHARGAVEKKLHSYGVYYGDGLSADSTVSAAPWATSAQIGALASGTTYHFYVRAFYDADGDGLPDFTGGKSEAVSVFMSRPSLSHSPERAFFFAGKSMPLLVTADADIASGAAYWSADGGVAYSALGMSASSRSASVSAPLPSGGGRIVYYFEITGGDGTVHRLPHDAPSGFYETAVVAVSSATARVSAASGNVDFGGGVRLKLEPEAMREDTLIFCEYSDYLDVPAAEGLTAAASYEFYALGADGRRLGVVFEKPAELTLRYFDGDVPAGFAENELIIARVDGSRATRLQTVARDSSANTVTARTNHLSSFGVFAPSGPAPETPPGLLKKVVRPLFSPSLGEVVEFDTDGRAVTVEIFDLKGVLIRRTDKNFWDGRDTAGVKSAPGVYLWRITPESGAAVYGSCVVVR